MSIDPRTRRFNPHRMLPAIETDELETSKAPEEYLFCPDEGSPSDATGRDFDEALEQIASERHCVCPLCGAIVSSDGSVVG